MTRSLMNVLSYQSSRQRRETKQRGLETEWVDIRHECTPSGIFSKLQGSAERCVANRNEQLKRHRFIVACDDNPLCFCVEGRPPIADDQARAPSVRFTQESDQLVVEGYNGIKVGFFLNMRMNEATCACEFHLDDSPQGKVQVVDLWQVLYRALEPLLFRSTAPAKPNRADIDGRGRSASEIVKEIDDAG